MSTQTDLFHLTTELADPAAAGAKNPLDNGRIAQVLEELAELLEAQHANPVRVAGWRSAAHTIANLDRPASAILERDGIMGLVRLPHIGVGLGRAIEKLLTTGSYELLDRLRGTTSPEELFATVPGIGPELADRIHHQLKIETLSELEAAAFDGRLAGVPGLGKRRVQAIRESLQSRIHPREALPVHADGEPPVAELLSIDIEYRDRVEADTLRKIAPQRFNPSGAAWLPILHCERRGRRYTALFSNSPRAHAMGTTHDWVVIYRDEDDGASGTWTVLTSRFGPLRGRRIVRGHEVECRHYYRLGAH